MRPRRFLPGLVVLVALTIAGCDDQTGPRWLATLRISQHTVTLAPGEAAPLEVLLFDQNRDPYDELLDWVRWEVSDSTVARVETEPGVVRIRALGPGSAVVRGTLGRVEDEVRVEVDPG